MGRKLKIQNWVKGNKMDISKVEFWGEKRFLFNMYEVDIVIDEVVYRSVEHFYQSQKFLDSKFINMVIDANRPKDSKNIAHKILDDNTNVIRDDFDDIKIDIMKKGVYAKFEQNLDLRKKLLAVDGEIVERNDWDDRFWGVLEWGEDVLTKSFH